MQLIGARLLEELESEQDRWFLWVPVLFGTGIAVYFALPVEPPTLLALTPAVLVLLSWAVWRQARLAFAIGGAAAALALGFAAAKLRTDWVAGPVLDRRIGPVELHGWIELVEPRPNRGQRLTLAVSRIERLPPEERPIRVRIRTMTADPELKPGDAVVIRVMLSPPAGPALPGGYDFARAAWYQGIGAVGFALAPVKREAVGEDASTARHLRAAIERLRQAIGRRITAVLPGEQGAIATALITGERGAISDATNAAYRDSGLLHILSISGLHMVVMAGAVFVSVRFLLSLVPALALRYAIKKWAASAAALGALGYLLISGGSPPTVRSYIMISIMFLAVLLDRPAMALRNVALAGLVILIVTPESLIDVGFQMSFAAVVALVSGYEILRERERLSASERRPAWLGIASFFGGIILSTLIASVAVAPFAAYHFHKSQQFAVVANLIAIPICNAFVMPAALATLLAMPLHLEWLPLEAMGIGIDAMTWCAYKVAALPGAVSHIRAIPAAAFALVLSGGIWFVLWGSRWRLLGLLPVTLGLALAPTLSLPDVLVGRNGGLVAVRTNAGDLSALSTRGGGMFELAQWLEYDGDARRPEDAAKAQAFRCDDSGCVVEIGSRIVAVAQHASALRDDCSKAALIVLAMRGTDTCGGATPSIGKDRLEALGPHAVFFKKDGGFRIETVAEVRGSRPWSQPARRRPRARSFKGRVMRPISSAE